MKIEKVLLFRFISAANVVRVLEDVLEEKMLECLKGSPKLDGKTLLLVDVSGSMEEKISSKSDLRRMDAAYGLAILLREVCENIRIFSFSGMAKEIPARHGFALKEAIDMSQIHGSTCLGKAIKDTVYVNADRIIVISDEQSHDDITSSIPSKAYMLNVGTDKNGVGYGKWINISGWSESVIDFILMLETDQNRNGSL